MLRALFRCLPFTASLVVLLSVSLSSVAPSAAAKSQVSDANHFDVTVNVAAPQGVQGAYASFSQYRPFVNPSDLESLAQEAVIDPTIHRDIEVGWIVDLSTYNDTYPHLFIYTRDKDKSAGQRDCLVRQLASGAWTCGFVSANDPYEPQPGLTSASRVPYDGSLGQIYIIHIVFSPTDSDFYIWYGKPYLTGVIGWIPDSYWAGSFSSVGYANWQGEVGVASPHPRTQMGNGTCGSKTGAAQLTDMNWSYGNGGPYASVNAPISSIFTTEGSLYNIGNFTGNSFTYGGPTGCP